MIERAIQKKALRCFIAMAFEKEDADKVYDRLIVPTLRRCGITPVRIDRLDHNDDVDNRIVSEIQACDFALADLTYARPSVYFEAGFAQRAVPVIYSCRRDHFSARAGDEFGNYRVHFDLQMKNIIRWSSPSDANFREKLARRVNRVIRPLVRARRVGEQEYWEAKGFDSISIEKRIRLIREGAMRRFRSAGYHYVPIIHYGNRLGWWTAAKDLRGGKLSVLLLAVAAKFQKRDLKWDYGSWKDMTDQIRVETRTGWYVVCCHVFVCSLSRITRQWIMACFPHLHASIQKEGIYAGTWGWRREGPAEYYLYVVDNIKSESSFYGQVSEQIKLIS